MLKIVKEKPTVLVVYGTRPEAIKVAPVVKALKNSTVLNVLTLTTGQHPEMVDAVNKVFDITPDYHLKVMVQGQGLNQLTSRVIEQISPLLEKIRPNAVLVQGDTTTVMATALAAFFTGIPVAHLEAGLRSGNIHLPFPEEANRRLAGQVTSLHLAPTSGARDNLLKENFDPDSIVVTGNTVIDALHQAIEVPLRTSDLPKPLAQNLKAPGLKVLITVHRRESWGKPLEQMCKAIAQIATERPEVLFWLPAHANPKVRTIVENHLGSLNNVTVTDPQPYGTFVHLLRACDLVVTDSGGIQEEAPSLGKPVLVLRQTTERPEAVEAGTVKLVGTSYQSVYTELTRLLTHSDIRIQMAKATNPYGDGHAAERVRAALEELLGCGKRMADFSTNIN